MKKFMIAILLLISLSSYSFELGPISNHNLSGLTGDLGFGVRIAAGTGSPTYVWRQYEEDINFTINDVSLFEFGSDRGNNDQRDIRFDSSGGAQVQISAPSGIEINVLNERIRQVQGPPMENMWINKNGNNLQGRAILGVTSNRQLQLARFSSDLDVRIPWNVPDGRYSFSTRVTGIYRVVSTATGGFWSENVNFLGNSNNFDIITYLQVTIDNTIDFGKVIFTSGAGERIRRENISVLGGQNTSVKMKVLEPKLLLKKVGKNQETIPVFIRLIDGGNIGEEIDIRLDNSGRKSLNFEVKIEPGLYPDIPEGRYAGVAKFEIKYN